MLTDISGPGQAEEAIALTPVVLKRRRVAGLVFENRTIKRHVDFTEVTFAGDVSFKGTSFLSGLVFKRAVFEGLVEFDGATFSGPVLLSQADAGADDFSSGDLLARLATADFERVKFFVYARQQAQHFNSSPDLVRKPSLKHGSGKYNPGLSGNLYDEVLWIQPPSLCGAVSPTALRSSGTSAGMTTQGFPPNRRAA